MTPTQYYFPYIFNIDVFNSGLVAFGLAAFILYDEQTGMPDRLAITHIQDTKKTLLTMPFGKTIMLYDNYLFYWETDTNLIDIAQVSLQNLTDDPWILNTKIDLTILPVGKIPFNAHLDIDILVTFAKKESIVHNQPGNEKYVIVLAARNHISIIPFDWFNNANSQFDYTWPATARMDTASGKLYGKGMRMPDFCIDIDPAWL